MKRAKKEVKDFFEFGQMLIENPKLAEKLPSEIFIPSGINLSEILSKKRLELLTYIAGHPNRTVNELSRKTKRKKEAVSRDLGILGKYNLVSMHRKGKQKQVETSIKYVLIPISS